MSIEVVCPSGHVLHVKDKFAGKAGLCPICRARVEVPLPALISDDEIANLLTQPADDASDVHSHVMDQKLSDSSSVSLVGSSILNQRTKTCPKCKSEVPRTYDLCPHCHTYFTNWGEIARRMSVRCPRCGTNNPSKRSRCFDCGEKLPGS